MNEYALAIERTSPSEDNLGGFSIFWENPREYIRTYVVKRGSKGFVVSPNTLETRGKEYCTQEDAEIAAFRVALIEGMEIKEMNTTNSKKCRFLDRIGDIPDDYRLGGRATATL